VTYGQAFIVFVREYMKTYSMEKCSMQIIGELADEFNTKTLAREKAIERNVKLAKKKEAAPKPLKECQIIPPDQELARKHHREQGYTFDFMKWWGCYSQNGWKVGKNAMKNWNASMVYWQGSDPTRPPAGTNAKPLPVALQEPEGWSEAITGHEELGRFVGREWASVPDYYQRLIIKHCERKTE
jgi:hypothetical protein